METTKPLSGQTAWITGSSRGLGRVMAEELCRLGATVAVHGTRADSPKTFGEGESMQQVADDIAAMTSGKTMPVWGDVTDESEVGRVATEIREKLGPIDILVCCAGGDIGAAGTGVGKGGRPEDDDCLNIALDDLKSVMDRNLTSAITRPKPRDEPVIQAICPESGFVVSMFFVPQSLLAWLNRCCCSASLRS